MFPGAILCGGSWTGAGSGIRVARRIGGGGWFLFLENVLLVLAKFSFLPGGWALGYRSMGFQRFPGIS